MYIVGTEQCSLPNSETPMSQARINRQMAFGNSVGTAFEQGDDTLNNLIETLGGNPAGATMAGASGVPTTGTLDTDTAGIPVVPQPARATSPILPNVNDPSAWAWGPSPEAPQLTPGGGAGYRPPQGEGRFARARKYRNQSKNINTFQAFEGPPAGCPVVVPLMTAIPVPSSAPAAPVSAPSAPTPAAPTSPAVANCRTGNWCLDIMNGCVLSSQVDPAQLLACSQAGYVGNKNLFPAIAAKGGAGGGAFFGTPEPNPPPYSPGMSGFGQDDSATVQAANASVFGSVLESIITAAATAAALAIIWKQRKR